MPSRILYGLNKEFMRTMNSNSVATYEEKVKPFLKESQQVVYNVLLKYDRLTSYEVLEVINISREKEGLEKIHLHQISGRFSEIRDMKLIKEVGRRKIKDSTFTIYEVIKPKVEANPGTQGNITF